MKNRVYKFMGATGLLENPDNLEFVEDLIYAKNKLNKMFREESGELMEALTVDEMLDGAVDSLFVLSQYMILLEQAGIDFQSACNAICDNNDSKYTTSIDLASKWLTEHHRAGNGEVGLCKNEHEGETFYCLKKNGKVTKPVDFVPVDLSKCIPKHLH